MNLYLVKRGPKPDHHAAPFHPVIVCANKDVAEWQADWTGDRAWMWVQTAWGGRHSGFLLLRWEGLVIDYGHVVRGGPRFPLPDGTTMGFHHRHSKPETWALLRGAVWWSTQALPAWLADAGVIAAPDEFSRRRIPEDERFVRSLRDPNGRRSRKAGD